MMTRKDIENGFRQLARSQGFYGRLLNFLEESSKEAVDNFYNNLLAQKPKDMVDVILFIECQFDQGAKV